MYVFGAFALWYCMTKYERFGKIASMIIYVAFLWMWKHFYL